MKREEEVSNMTVCGISRVYCQRLAADRIGHSLTTRTEALTHTDRHTQTDRQTDHKTLKTHRRGNNRCGYVLQRTHRSSVTSHCLRM